MPRVNVMLPEDLLTQIEQVAREEGVNRSKLLRKAVLAYFEQRQADSQRRRRQTDIQRAMEIQDSLRQAVPPWDVVKALREQREEP